MNRPRGALGLGLARVPRNAGMYRQNQYEFRSQSEEGKPGLCDG